MSPRSKEAAHVQVLLVQVPSELARRAKEIVGSKSPYGSFSELVVAALQNQLVLHGLSTSVKFDAARPGEELMESVGLAAPNPAGTDHPLSRALGHAPTAPDDLLPDNGSRSNGRFFVLTNRLTPLKLAARVLANLRSRDGEWPQLERFRVDAATTARAMGLKFRHDDERRGARGSARHAVGFPIGPDAGKAMERYVASFTLDEKGRGPMTVLGLGGIREERVVLTEAGWKLAVARSPILGEIDGESLGAEERQIMLGCLVHAPAELKSVREFLGVVRKLGPSQDKLDQFFTEQNSRWTRNRIVAERASMIGRLKDLGLVTVNGRGRDAEIHLTVEGDRFAQEVSDNQ